MAIRFAPPEQTTQNPVFYSIKAVTEHFFETLPGDVILPLWHALLANFFLFAVLFVKKWHSKHSAIIPLPLHSNLNSPSMHPLHLAMQAIAALLTQILCATLGERCPQADQQRYSCCQCQYELTWSGGYENTHPKSHIRTQVFSVLPADTQQFWSETADWSWFVASCFPAHTPAKLFQTAEVCTLQCSVQPFLILYRSRMFGAPIVCITGIIFCVF